MPLTKNERRALAAHIAATQTPPSTEVDMANTETCLDQQETAAPNNVIERQIAEILERLKQHDESIQENEGLITIADGRVSDFEQEVKSMEKDIEKAEEAVRKLRYYCKKKIEGFSDDLDDFARNDENSWDRVRKTYGKDEMSKIVRTLTDENAALKQKLEAQSKAIQQREADMEGMMRRLTRVESIALKHMFDETEKKLRAMDV
ncbi:hypothetical protein IL306_012115 [Fusarium sp. DS 682]|nr:hypothetical protein IL306_012115 [Fusarium sp. DS 682]